MVVTGSCVTSCLIRQETRVTGVGTGVFTGSPRDDDTAEVFMNGADVMMTARHVGVDTCARA